MDDYVTEAFLPVSRAECVVEKVCARAGDYCRSIRATAADKVLDFGDARAILRPADDGLHFRVEARDPITFYGVRTLLQASLSVITMVRGDPLEWYPPEHASLGVPYRHSGSE